MNTSLFVVQEKILENSSKYKLYEKLNKECGDKCTYVSYCSKVQYLEKWYSGFLNVCYMFARNWINLHEILSEETDKDKHCRYINFWITDYVRKKLETQWKNVSFIGSIFRFFITVKHSITSASRNNNCHFDYISEADINLWKEWKHLHDYIENYNDIKQRISSHGNFCTKYSKYFAYIKGLHDKHKGKCCNGSSNKCRYHIDLSYICKNDSLFNELKCDKTKGITAVTQGDGKHQPMDVSQEGEKSPSIINLIL
ncbi:PIR Superfamily Protein [Plasmodium ovale wallikeri]|uniref:PIR Superfamily Protein n=1 Tax=Plasmodium ovale wallikeri TaxID=864142 RepID=A0A1A9AN26_PLAOA|nr:PIR Superfamily Protein [Plasmodium ovale wallikeri]